MKFGELLMFSVSSLWRRKLRTVLTILGVTIGTASIVVMMSLGLGLSKSFTGELDSSASLTLINVYNYSYMEGSDSKSVTLTKDSVSGFTALDHVTAASPVYSFSVIAKSGKYEAYLNINAMSLDMLKALNMPILEGQLPTEGEELQLIAGKQCGYNFYDPKGNGDMYRYGYEFTSSEPTVDLYETPVFVIYDTNAYYQSQGGQGTMPKKYLLETCATVGNPGAEGYSQYDYSCYADMEAVETLFNKLFKKNAWPNQQLDSKGKLVRPMTFNEAYVLVDDIENVSAVQQQLVDMGYQASSQLDYLESMKQLSRTIQYVLGGIGSVSLIVAAIGITNTMLMSIFERTKEIGIYKVLGCSLGNIRSMFLSEAGLIGFGGGVLGLALSFLLSFAINKIVAQPVSIIPAWLALVGIGFAVVVGMVAGISPAVRAMKLSPLEAIRTL